MHHTLADSCWQYRLAALLQASQNPKATAHRAFLQNHMCISLSEKVTLMLLFSFEGSIFSFSNTCGTMGINIMPQPSNLLITVPSFDRTDARLGVQCL